MQILKGVEMFSTVNREFTYDPPSDCIGYAFELKQVKPGTSLGNESTLICLLTQTM